MPKGPIRRAQLVAPFGVGAMVVVRDGTSIMTAGLDHWYEREDRDSDPALVDVEEYKFQEWRLERLLGVNHFRLPPDYRRIARGGPRANSQLTVPFVRFPRWHFCPYCGTMKKVSLSAQGKQDCDVCLQANRRWKVVQVPFVAICDHGHISEFPWRQWVHRSRIATCREQMTLEASGGSSLAAQRVSCACGARRNLSGITEADEDFQDTFLSRMLESGDSRFNCQGHKPWLGLDEPTECGRPLKGSLRSAGNIYYADQESSIYIPRQVAVSTELSEILETPPISGLIGLLRGAGGTVTAENIRQQYPTQVALFTDDQINSVLTAQTDSAENLTDNGYVAVDSDPPKTAFRRPEYQVLNQARPEDNVLMIESADLSSYSDSIRSWFSSVMLVHKLRETRAFAGFSRLRASIPLDNAAKQSLLRRNNLPVNSNWLPAYIVHGEGIMLNLHEEALVEWENRPAVVEQAMRLQQRFNGVRPNEAGIEQIETSARFILLHTLSRILINQLIYSCGYSSAALRERVYCSRAPGNEMAAILIYTAAGDSDGTLGGLVRMGKPEYFNDLVEDAISKARWCSADPVCMELGQSSGQGPMSCNLAACHSCALLPETSCEEFNRFLDRTMLIGSHSNSGLGYFQN
ncbi:MAG: DUF1998 domain-containing protein [Planctomycetota bacterium]